MRVTFVADAPGFGGAESYLARLLVYLPDRFAPMLLATDPVAEQLRTAALAAGATIVIVAPPRRMLDPFALSRLLRALRAGTPDLVHVNLASPTNNRHGLAAAALSRVPTVATVHSYRRLRLPVRTAMRLTYLGVDRVIAICRAIERELVEDLGVPPDRVRRMLHGVPLAPPRPAPTGDTLTIGGLGRLSAEKGFDVLVAALGGLHRRGLPFAAVVGGDGAEAEALREQAAGLPVSFCGFQEDPGEFLSRLDVFCQPSREEAVGLALLEAMMRGVACVATDVGDVAETVGDAGIVVPPADASALERALERLVADPGLRRQMGTAARARALDRHRLEDMVAATAAVYDETLAGRG